MVVVLLGLLGCSTQAKRVNCEGYLEPINQAAHRAAPASASAVPKDPQGVDEK